MPAFTRIVRIDQPPASALYYGAAEAGTLLTALSLLPRFTPVGLLAAAPDTQRVIVGYPAVWPEVQIWIDGLDQTDGFEVTTEVVSGVNYRRYQSISDLTGDFVLDLRQVL